MFSYGGNRTPLTLHASQGDGVDLAQERAIALETALALLAQALLILDNQKLLLAAAHADMAQHLVLREQAKALSHP